MRKKVEQRKLKEFVMSMPVNQKLEQEDMKEFMVKFLMNQKLKQDDGVPDQSVNDSRTTQNDEERADYHESSGEN